MSILLLQGNALKLPLADQSVHCCISSPPYWGLRDYGTGTWSGGDPTCSHTRRTSLAEASITTESRPTNTNHEREGWKGGLCGHCGATREDQQLGLEAVHDCNGAFTGQSCGQCYVCHLRAVFTEVWRVLRNDGTLWLNLGDTYTSGGRIGHGTRQGYKQQTNRGMNGTNDPPRAPQPLGLAEKNLVGIPWRVALALQADGWTLRSEIIWHKPSVMPESVQDRPTKAHEQVFLLVKQARYWFDGAALDEPAAAGWRGSRFEDGKNFVNHPNVGQHRKALPTATYARHRSTIDGGQSLQASPNGLRHVRSVWSIPAEPYHAAHFATMPQGLVTRCIKAGCPAGGIVLDPFVGSGTVPLTARGLGRHGVGMDFSWSYLQLARERLGLAALQRWQEGGPAHAARVDDLPLFAQEVP